MEQLEPNIALRSDANRMFDKSSESIGILTTTFLSAIALYFSVEKPEPKKMTIIDIIFIWFYIVNGLTITIFSLSSLITEKIHVYSSGLLKFLIPLSLISIAFKSTLGKENFYA